MDKNKIIKLDYLSSLDVSGEGASELLQGQISCDINKGKENIDYWSSLGVLCNVKGRVISSFLVSSGKLHLSDDSSKPYEYSLIGPRKTLLKTKEVLDKYLPFYKDVEIKESRGSYYAIPRFLRTKEKPDYKTHSYLKEQTLPKYLFDEVKDYCNKFCVDGMFGLETHLELHDYLGKDYLLGICGLGKPTEAFEKNNNNEFEDKLDNWYLDDILHRNVEITVDMSEKYTPHELLYDKTGRIDFDKGCYTGQEVVARMHYRSKSLPRLYLAECEGKDIKENMTLCNEKNNKVGSLIKAVNFLEKSLCLISTKEKNLISPLRVRETNSNLNII